LGSLWCGQQSIFFCAKFHSNVKNTFGYNPYKGSFFFNVFEKIRQLVTKINPMRLI
jgi:hypothetical protein